MTQGNLAKLSGISQPMISGIERNKKAPSAQTIAQLADGLETPEQNIYYLARKHKK